MLFAVLSYQTRNEEILAALRTARAHLRDGGLFLADVWYGPAVIACPPSRRSKRFRDGDREWIRWTSSTHVPSEQTVTVHYRVDELGDGGVVASVEEEHDLRYFFPQELRLLLELAGLELVECAGWPELDAAPDNGSYAVMVIARAPAGAPQT